MLLNIDLIEIIIILLTINGLSSHQDIDGNQDRNQLNNHLIYNNNKRVENRLNDKFFDNNFDSNDSKTSYNNRKSNPISGHFVDKTSGQSADPTGLLLSSDPLCKKDIESMCGRTATDLDNNFAVLDCIQNQHREEGIGLSSECHHLIWSY